MNRIKDVIVIACFACLAASCSNTGETCTVAEQTFNEAVYASGELFPETCHILKSGVPDRILKLAVKEGDNVRQGDVLVVLGTPADSGQIALLESLAAIAKSNARENSATLSEIRQKIALAQQQYEHDERNAGRYRELLNIQAVSRKETEQSVMIAEKSRAGYNGLQQQYIAQKSRLANQLLEAENRLAEARRSQQAKELTSPVSGRIYSINFKEGELAASNEAILMIGSPDRYRLELSVDERDINKIGLGQKVFFETDAFAGRQFEAVVVKINPVLQKETRNFNVEATVESNGIFYPQSSVEAGIVIRERAKALMIPSDYLLQGDSVLLQSSIKEARKIKVTTGIRNDNCVEIINGLKTGDIILKKQ
ncbi:MAG: efflux RND transporter periplasmic adaptor subunit [Tannerella sp.]|nr:efflux RND transporter periplasmic adaptor subunit [Tannerella sp.]